ncbi:Globin-coupled histidine kinase [Anatilimnocola aggregata]|uniref:histidine kinase n=1 Tax=Anatilimnocola aggregata TaxID=2528021 RepID=A0A517Y7J7_9BACT|nr:protoglobin domain-containing protein [Anatilimnocola aggregata]QDU26210.1 Globin-coupled histidine kinase [Anatilimnocola aggregata]
MTAFLRYQELQRYVGWTDVDSERVQSVGPLLASAFGLLIDDFYAEIEHHPDASKVITGGAEQISRLKRSLHRWLEELFSGKYDREYVERRWRVGHRHVDIGLSQVYTNVALSRLRHGLLRTLEDRWERTPAELLACRGSLNSLLDLDLAIIEDAYQTEYQRRQATAERLATIGKVAGGIAHELRNPLNVVKTSVYFLLNARDPSEEKKRVHLERIERQVGLADSVITALNDFARLPTPELQPVEIEACLRDVLDLVCLPTNIQQEWHIASSGLKMLGDRSQLGIVFGNLIRNARDAMPQGGTLRFYIAVESEMATIRFQDTGKGIPPEHVQHIFEPLYSTKAKGIGLGLSISRDIVDRHQGTLTVATEPNAGCSFYVRLPAAR